MKKSNLVIGIIYTLAGITCLLFSIVTESKSDGLLSSFAGAGIATGILMIYRYFYWLAPENKNRYQERLENEEIDRHDELKEKLRDKSGRYAYLLGLAVVCMALILYSVLGALEIVDHSRVIVLCLGGYLIFQFASGIAFFRYLIKKM